MHCLRARIDVRRVIALSCLAALLVFAAAHSAAAQVPKLESLKASPPPEAQQQAQDPLGRTTPRGTLTEFLAAVERDDFVSAARYMQLTEGNRRNAEPLARDLKALIDRYFIQSISSISDAPDGALDDGLPPDRERIGPLAMGDKKLDIILVRVTDPQYGPIWLISSATLVQVAALDRALGKTWVERVMPGWLVHRILFGISLAHWVLLAAILALSFAVLAMISSAVLALARWMVRDPARRGALEAWYAATRWPAITALALVAQLILIRLAALPLTFRIVYGRIALVLLVIVLTWLARRVLALGFARARSLVWGRERTSTQSLMLLGERMLKLVVVLAAGFAILTIAGVDTKTALAGLGIGGIALALGAQRTVENLLGGVFLLTDKAIAVGDLCKISDRLGFVEDITLRSVRLRTLDQSVMSVPAGMLAQAGIENFASREKILAKTILRLRYGTTVEQLRRILERIGRLLEEHDRLERNTSHVRLIDFGEQAVELELFAYVLTGDIPEFLVVREELLLEIAAIVETAGSGFAQPTQFIYMEGKPPHEVAIRSSAPRESAARSEVRALQSPNS